MTKEIGYYSLIQYCPDQTIGEVANIGVLLFAPKSRFVNVRVASTNERVARIFGGGVHKYDTLQQYKEGLADWVKTEKHKFESMEGARNFLAAYVNRIAFTPIRSVICPDGAEMMIESLFQKFFPDDATPKTTKHPHGPYVPRKRIFQALQKKCGREIASKLAILPELAVVGSERTIQPAFAFQNEHFNVVFSKAFSSERYDEQIGFGLLISRKMKMAEEKFWKQSVPVILGRLPSRKHNLSRDISETLGQLQIGFYDSEEKLIDYVEKEAKPLPTFAEKFAAAKVEPSLFDYAAV